MLQKNEDKYQRVPRFQVNKQTCTKSGVLQSYFPQSFIKKRRVEGIAIADQVIITIKCIKKHLINYVLII